MPRLANIAGKRFGRLVVISRDIDHFTESGNRQVTWICRCDCGANISVRATHLRNGHTKSCGCLKKEGAARRVRKMNTTHGLRNSRLYSIWRGMINRCNNKKHKSSHIYMGRGIKVCEEWRSFEVFRNWAIANGYEPSLTIDRIDNDSGYSPCNCRWVSIKAQANNRRANRKLTFNGLTKTISEWSDATGITAGTIADRIDRGWDEQSALTIPAVPQEQRGRPVMQRKGNN